VKLPPKSGRHLIVPAIVAAALFAVGATAVIGAQQFLQKARSEQQKAAADRQAAQSRLARATDEEREIRDTLVDYEKLLKRGLIGEEQRQDWVDRLGQIKAARKLFDVKYTVDPQRPVDYPGIAGPGEVEFLASQMKLDLSLLHEEDLFRFLEDLRGALNTHVVVRSCTIQRLEQPASERTLTPRLHADCALDLVTIRDRKAKAT
jgi:cell division protein FtsB